MNPPSTAELFFFDFLSCIYLLLISTMSFTRISLLESRLAGVNDLGSIYLHVISPLFILVGLFKYADSVPALI